MSSRLTAWIAALALAITALALGGCVVAPATPYYGEPVVVAPSPPVVGHVWIGGTWRPHHHHHHRGGHGDHRRH